VFVTFLLVTVKPMYTFLCKIAGENSGKLASKG